MVRRISEMDMRFRQRTRRCTLHRHKRNSEICGVQDAKKLMEDILNKVRDMLGILVDVNWEEKDDMQYLEIATEAYPYPISFRGKYYQ